MQRCGFCVQGAVMASARPVAEAFNEFGLRQVAEVQARRRAEDEAHVRQPMPLRGHAGVEALLAHFNMQKGRRQAKLAKRMLRCRQFWHCRKFLTVQHGTLCIKASSPR